MRVRRGLGLGRPLPLRLSGNEPSRQYSAYGPVNKALIKMEVAAGNQG